MAKRDAEANSLPLDLIPDRIQLGQIGISQFLAARSQFIFQ